MESSRLEAFSDGVFAVAITLLALDLAVPGPGGESLAAKLTHHLPSFAAFVVSFLTIGIIWVNHHALFTNVARVDRTLLFVNLLLLFFVVCIPFAAKTFAEYLRDGHFNASVAGAIFNGVLLGMGLAFALLFWYSNRRDHLKVPPGGTRAAVIRFGVGNIAYLAAIGVAFLNPSVSLLMSGLVAIYYVFEQTSGRRNA